MRLKDLAWDQCIGVSLCIEHVSSHVRICHVITGEFVDNDNKIMKGYFASKYEVDDEGEFVRDLKDGKMMRFAKEDLDNFKEMDTNITCIYCGKTKHPNFSDSNYYKKLILQVISKYSGSEYDQHTESEALGVIPNVL